MSSIAQDVFSRSWTTPPVKWLMPKPFNLNRMLLRNINMRRKQRCLPLVRPLKPPEVKLPLMRPQSQKRASPLAISISSLTKPVALEARPSVPSEPPMTI